MNNNLDVFKSDHEPFWIATTEDTNYPALNQDIKVDAAIVGGGIVGILTAYLLKNKGLKVAVLEANKILKGTTGHTTAKITSQHSLIYDKLIRSVGEELAKQYAQANEAAIQFINKLAKEKNIDCDFQWRDNYVYTQSEQYIENIQNEVKAAASLGLKASYEENIPLPFKIKCAVKFENQAQYHPRKFLLPLAKDIPGDGSYIFENTVVVDIDDGDNRKVMTKNGYSVTATDVVIASHYPCYDRLGLYFTRIAQERAYALAAKVKEKFPEGMFITAEDPARSLRSQPFEDGEIIIVSGEHHKTGHDIHTNAHYENLANFTRQNYIIESILYRWSTQDCMTLDGIPYVGRIKSGVDNIYVATGFGKWGMTNGTASAIILTDLITKGENEWSEVYSPSRGNIDDSIKSFVTQNSDVAVNFVKGKLSNSPSEEEVNIKNGEAKVVMKEEGKYGIYRDEEGKLHTVDTTCTHLGCEAVWNEAEKTWDCPCHGSRFNYDGLVVESPAFKPLKQPGEGKNTPDPNIF